MFYSHASLFLGLTQQTTKRRTVDKRSGFFEQVQVDCPEVVVHYNTSKDAVDQFDKHCLKDNFSLERSQVSRKWWHKLYWGLLDSTLVNSFLLWTMCHGDCDKYTFMTMVQQGMLHWKEDQERVARSRTDRKRSDREALKSIEGAHFPERIPDRRRLVCEVCKNRSSEERSKEDASVGGNPRYKKPTRSMFWCVCCRIPLCVEPCFGMFHVKATPKSVDVTPKKPRLA